MRMGSRHWVAAVIMAIALHAGVVAAMFWQRADAGAKAPGIGGIEIALGPAGGAPRDVSAEEHSTGAGEAARAEPATEPPPLEPPPLETAQPMPEPPPEPAEPEIPEVIEPITDVTEAEPPTDAVEETPLIETAEIVESPTDAVEETPLVETAQIVEQAVSVEETPVTEPRAATVPPRPKPKPSPPEPPRAVAKPEPAPEPEPVPEPIVENVPSTAMQDRLSEARPPATEPAATPDSGGPDSGGKAGARETASAGSSAADAAAGGRPAAKADYGAILLAWLERHKEYPRVAQKRRQQGVVLLHIVLDRGGRVIEAHIQESSGYRLLDDAALAMLKRAQPLPPIPDDIQEERLRFVVPVQFFVT